MDNPTLQFSMLLFLLFTTHMYFLINKILIKKQKSSINYFESGLILFAFGITIIIFGIVYNDFILNYSSIKENKILSFITTYKDLILILIATVTAFFIYRQIKTAQQTTQEQIKVAQDSLDKQIKYQNKIKDTEIIMSMTNKLVDKAYKLVEDERPMPKSYLNTLRKTDYKNHSFHQNFTLKLTEFSDANNEKIIFLPWYGLREYYSIIKNKYPNELENFIKVDYEHEYKCIYTYLSNIINYCHKLFQIDQNNLLYIHTLLIDFSSIVEQLETVVKHLKIAHFSNNDNFFNSYYMYIELYKSNINPKNNVMKYLDEELNKNKLLNIKFDEENIQDIEFNHKKNKEDEYIGFKVKVNSKFFYRNKGIWSKIPIL